MTMKPRLAVAIWLSGIAASILVIAGTHFKADMSAFLPRAPSPAQAILVDQMQNGAASRLILAAVENVPVPILAAVSKDIATRLRQNEAFALVNNGAEIDAAETGSNRDRDLLWRNRYVLSPGVTAQRFTVPGLRAALDADVALLGSDLAPLVKRTLPSDPTGEMLTLIRQLAGQGDPNRREGVWFSADGGRALLVVQTRAPGFDLAAEEQALAALDRAFADAQHAVPGASAARLLVTGPGVFAVHTKTEMKEDISRLSLIATVLVSAVLLFAYRSPRILVLALLPVASGALAGIAAVSLGFGFVHGLTLGFGVTLIGEAVDYAIYLFTQTAPGTPPQATLPRIWPMLRLGVLISICGFSAMLFSSFTGFAQLGLFSITGLIVAVAVTRWVLPGLLPRNFATNATAAFAPALLRVVRRAHRLRIPALIVVAGAVFLLAFHRGGFWEDDLASLSPVPSADQALDRTLRNDIGAADLRYLVIVTAADEQRVLAKSERLTGLFQDLAAQGLIAGFDAPSRYLPSVAMQRTRLDALPDPATLRARLAEALVGSPLRSDLFEPFFTDVATAQSEPLLDRAGLQGTSLALKLESQLFERHGAWTGLLSLRGVADAPRVAQEIARLDMDGVTFVDLKTESDNLLETYRHEAVMLALIGSLAIIVLLAVSLRSPRRVLSVVLPLAAAVIVAAAVLTIGSHKLSIFNLMGFLLAVAVGSNYCVFFERQDWADPHCQRTVASVVLANLCTVIGFGILAFSRLPVLYGIGLTVALGAFLSLVFSAIVTSRDVPGQARAQE